MPRLFVSILLATFLSTFSHLAHGQSDCSALKKKIEQHLKESVVLLTPTLSQRPTDIQTTRYGNHTFISLTHRVQWDRGPHTLTQNSAQYQKLGFTPDSLFFLQWVAAQPLSSDCRELDAIIQARCLLFVSSPTCEGVPKHEAISCRGSAAQIFEQALDPLTAKQRAEIVMEVTFNFLKDLGSNEMIKQGIQGLDALVPGIGPMVGVVRAARTEFKDLKAADEIRKQEKMSWIQALLQNNQKKKDRIYCYTGGKKYEEQIHAAIRATYQAGRTVTTNPPTILPLEEKSPQAEDTND